MVKLKLLLCFSVLSYMVKAQTPANDQNWDSNNLILQDDFTGTTLDANKWSAINGNWDSRFDFTSANVTVNNSSGTNCVNLIATNGNTSGKPIHAGGIISKNTIGCGYFEIRCKIASMGSSYMPAFWVIGSNNCDCSTSGCSNGWYKEIDFFEIICTPHAFNVSSNGHYYLGNCNHNNGEELFLPFVVSGDALYNEFHTYGYEWTPGKIICYLDGNPYRYSSSSLIDNTPLSLWVNMGFNGQITDANFPGYTYVDYVKVYNLKRNCIDEAIANFNSSTYSNYSVKRTISISGTSNISSVHKVTLRAQDGITINGDFTVQQGGELTLLSTNCY